MKITENLLPHGRERQQPKRIIVHAMAEWIDNRKAKTDDRIFGAAEWLDYLKVSAHMLVLPNGEVIRCRHDQQGAYHARGYNTDSLGIEFLVAGIHDYTTWLRAIKRDYVTQWAYAAGVQIIREWIDLYGITDIDRHSDVSPGRKADPGTGFNWKRLMNDVTR